MSEKCCFIPIKAPFLVPKVELRISSFPMSSNTELSDGSQACFHLLSPQNPLERKGTAPGKGVGSGHLGLQMGWSMPMGRAGPCVVGSKVLEI